MRLRSAGRNSLGFVDINGSYDGGPPLGGMPAGVISRSLGSGMGFTPLAEGLDNLGLTLCTTPDCDLRPETVEQPTE